MSLKSKFQKLAGISPNINQLKSDIIGYYEYSTKKLIDDDFINKLEKSSNIDEIKNIVNSIENDINFTNTLIDSFL